jgi:hypothetical protein
MFFKRRKKGAGEGATATVEPPAGQPTPDYDGSDEQLWAEIAELSARADAERDTDADRRLIALRHIAGIRRVDTAPADARQAEPDTARLPEQRLPEFTPDELTPQLLRAAILRDGCALVRGLVPRERALAFAAEIDRSFEERDRDGGEAADGYYEEFRPHVRYLEGEIFGRDWIREGGGVLAVDAPALHTELHELFRDADLAPLVEGYLGEPPLISAHKTTLRKADPSVPGGWHQDGKFMGPVRALNLWLSLSRCGDESPGLDLVPRRLEHFLEPGGDETRLDFQVSQRMAEDAAGDVGIVRPIFEPGDALFFDDMFLHKTGSDPSMPKPRYAIENWFFGGSAFPRDYAPIAL